MKITTFILMLAALIVLPILLVAGGVSAVETAVAAPSALPQVLCNRLYLPAIINGAAVGGTAVHPADLIAPPGLDMRSAECAGFPDFNGDGYADLVIGAPRKGNFDTGIVQVVYGSAAGLNAGDGAVIDDQVWHRQLGGVAAETDDWYGAAVAIGDFNRDGYDDLAVGIPGATIDGLVGAGAVQIIYGSAAGLTNDGIQEWSQANSGVSGDPELNANFGAALTSGDFDGDGYADLALGAHQANVNGDTYAGAVHVLYGRSSGLGALGSELITQDTPGFVASPTEPFDYFGWALAAGDFNGDGVDDLAVGTPFEDNGVGYADAGSVQIFFGKSGNTIGNSGLLILGAVVDPQHWRADSANVEGLMEENDRFGFALAVGDFDGDGYDDLAVGIPYETHGEGAGALAFGGAVNVIMGSANGLEATPAKPGRLWHQDLTGMNGDVDTLDRFGWALAAADFDNDGYADLAIGVPGDDYILGIVDTGSTQIVYGSDAGLTTTGNTLHFHASEPTADDLFGAALFAADFNGDGNADLAVGAPNDAPTAANGGSVFTFYSNATIGLLQMESQTWYPGFNGLMGTAVAADYFGEALPGSPRR